ncbi:radical SAM/SPASM domain-containing protein [Carboxydothermus pertinax]|uniref:Radical SAM/SPASM domain-containing protein n=1 Tax=Carboxydothermus pertinax TaxID=870242 RepID=A0A1L8CU32_9THEO|nr:radical SAM protein [Carboxydothermus pertinax]GAV22423.1 radical SAM/SPASM domain-containing protein [Carboxydothermus pertinax]
MYYSKYNLVLPFEDRYLLLNPLSGAVDLLEEKDLNDLEELRKGSSKNFDRQFTAYLEERGYIYQNRELEEKKLLETYQEFLEISKTSPTQIFFAPTYNCNLACSYCFQQGIKDKKDLPTKEVLDAFFSYVNQNFKNEPEKPFLTLFGGEPLIDSEYQKEVIAYFLYQAKINGYEVSIVTNGYALKEYMPILTKGVIREVQITVDGPPEIHDQRRITKGGGKTFARIFEGMLLLKEAGIPINLRAVVDKSNLITLVDLAKILEDKGFLDLPKSKFKTQIGRNYELFECQDESQSLFDRLSLWAEYAKLSKEYPILQKFHLPEFKGVKYLVDNGEMPFPTYDNCPALKKEWAFDYQGKIYGCTANVGRDEFMVGTFYPEVKLWEEKIKPWQQRSILTIPKCRDCEVALLCGGGCGTVAYNREKTVFAPDCRPLRELWEIGVNYYNEEIKALGEE